METQNITLSLPKKILRKVKMLAVKRHTSVSGLVTQALEDLVEKEDFYNEARKRQLAWLVNGFDLGLGTQNRISREELHER
jgi:predicted transcriptional regulator